MPVDAQLLLVGSGTGWPQERGGGTRHCCLPLPLFLSLLRPNGFFPLWLGRPSRLCTQRTLSQVSCCSAVVRKGSLGKRPVTLLSYSLVCFNSALLIPKMFSVAIRHQRNINMKFFSLAIDISFFPVLVFLTLRWNNLSYFWHGYLFAPFLFIACVVSNYWITWLSSFLM